MFTNATVLGVGALLTGLGLFVINIALGDAKEFIERRGEDAEGARVVRRIKLLSRIGYWLSSIGLVLFIAGLCALAGYLP